MKKLQRALALALAAMLTLGLFSVGVSAKSATPTETLEVKKNVQIKQNSTIPNENFVFQMVPATEDELQDESGNALKTATGDIEIKSGPELKKDGVTDNTISIAFGSNDDTSTAATGNTAIVTKTATFDLTKIAFTDVGVYRYYITEVAGTNTFIDYDDAKYQVDLYVYKYDNSFGVGDVVVAKVGSDAKPTDIAFTNDIKTCDMTISKTVSGDEYTTNEGFTFYLRIPAGGDKITLSAGDTIHAEIWSKKTNTMISENDIKVKRDLNAGEAMDMTNEELAQAFTLHDGEYLKVEAPVSMIFFVSEANVTAEGYEQKYTYTESGTHNSETKDNNTSTPTAAINEDGSMVILKGTVNDGMTKVEYTNTRNVTPDTGLSLDMVPYVLITLIAVCGVALLVCKKKATR
jgi:pilin isopeptide linkage protein